MIETAPFAKCHLMLTEDCNLRCKYCYENSNRVSNYMSFETAKNTVDFLIDNAIEYGNRELQITCFGGEPLLNLDVMIKVFHYALDKANQSNISLFFSIITNGTIYNKQFEEFILEWYKRTGKVSFQISIDGIPEVQDKNRIFFNGEPTSEIVAENMEKIKKLFIDNQMYNASFNTHSVLTKDNISKLFENYKYFRNHGIREIEFVLADEEDWDENDALIYIGQLNLIANYVYEECISTYSLQSYRQAKSILGLESERVFSRTCPAGNGFVAVAANGDIYPCSRIYFYNRGFRLGNVYDGIIIDNQVRKTFMEACRRDMYSGEDCCGECKNPVCKICMAYNYQKNGSLLKCNELLCWMYNAKWKFISETKKRFDKLIDGFNFNKCNETSFYEVTN